MVANTVAQAAVEWKYGPAAAGTHPPSLFLTPTLITGFFGINTKGLPFADSERGSLTVFILAVGSAVLAYAIIRILGVRAPGK